MELKLVDERHGGKFGPDDDDKTEGRGIMDRLLFVLLEMIIRSFDFDVCVALVCCNSYFFV